MARKRDWLPEVVFIVLVIGGTLLAVTVLAFTDWAVF